MTPCIELRPTHRPPTLEEFLQMECIGSARDMGYTRELYDLKPPRVFRDRSGFYWAAAMRLNSSGIGAVFSVHGDVEAARSYHCPRGTFMTPPNISTNSAEYHRCSTLLCGGHGMWRKPRACGGSWENKCQTCFDRNVSVREQDQWSSIIRPG